MEHKRITLIAGHYGSGKTNIAINLAFALRKETDNVALADLDIVNPYFRAKDSQEQLENADIKFICSPYANSNIDIPALPQEMYAITDDNRITAVVDIGGDDRGAYALGRYAPSILEENNYEMLLVINSYRPLTRGVGDLITIKEEIESAGKIPFTAIVNNSNLAQETTAQTVLDSLEYANEISRLCNLPIKMTTVSEKIYSELCGKIDNLFPLSLQEKIF